MKSLRTTLATALAAMTVAATAQQRADAPYLTQDEMPDGVVILPSPPDTTDAAFFNDWLVYNRGLKKRHSPRGKQAKADAEYSWTYIANYYSKAIGIEINAEKTPAIFHLISRAARTGGDATWKPKKHYQRRRPFVVFNQHTMTPDHERDLARNGSYPSGHTSMGWAVALVLAEVCPDAQDSILYLGYQYGQSRTIVGAHWQSDVDAGRVMASAAVARMHCSPDFQADMAAAKAEYAKITGKDSVKMPNVMDPQKAQRRRSRHNQHGGAEGKVGSPRAY